MARCLLIINPVSGNGEGKSLQEPVAGFLSDAGFAVTTVFSKPEHSVESYAKEASTAGYDVVFVLGGDGSINEAVNGIMAGEQRPKLGFLPLGTANDLANNLHFPTDHEDALEALRDFTWVPLDVGRINTRYFIDAVAIGSLPEAVMNTSDRDKNTFGFLAYVKDGALALFEREAHTFRVTHDKTTFTVKTPLMLVTIGNTVAGIKEIIPSAEINDGLLHFTALKDEIALTEWPGVISALIQRKLEDSAALKMFQTKQLTITSEGASAETIQTNVDGDKGPELPAELSVINGALEVMVPRTLLVALDGDTDA